MERPKSSDQFPQTIEKIREVIVRSTDARILFWASQLHEVPFSNEMKLSDMYHSNLSLSGQFDAFLRTEALGKGRSMGSVGFGEIKESIRQLTETVTDPIRRYPKNNSLTIGDIRTLKDGVIRRMGLDPFQVFIVRKLFGYESEDGLSPRDWIRNLESISMPVNNPDAKLKYFLKEMDRKSLLNLLDITLPKNYLVDQPPIINVDVEPRLS